MVVDCTNFFCHKLSFFIISKYFSFVKLQRDKKKKKKKEKIGIEFRRKIEIARIAFRVFFYRQSCNVIEKMLTKQKKKKQKKRLASGKNALRGTISIKASISRNTCFPLKICNM